VIYHKSIEQALVILPALFGALITIAGGEPLDEGGKLDFKVALGDPPPCVTGFIPAPFIRSPSDTTVRDLPTDLYCKVPQNDPSAVRGARNYPCQEFPGKRAPTVQLCRDPKGYIPIGNNPWRGPPVPAGTPVTDGRNILPPNKYPYIPPENDPDPGPPVVGPLPPGVPEGPGPAPHQPWPVQPPPNYSGPPVPLPYLPPGPYPPQDPSIPYPATIPPPPPPVGIGPAQASARYGTYDQHSGTFVDPDGGSGVYAPGDPNLRPAENWVDLMLDPRQV
jgi:phospholipid/cholesterol/gamma-HCH transport system substrate-binding protein